MSSILFDSLGKVYPLIDTEYQEFLLIRTFESPIQARLVLSGRISHTSCRSLNPSCAVKRREERLGALALLHHTTFCPAEVIFHHCSFDQRGSKTLKWTWEPCIAAHNVRREGERANILWKERPPSCLRIPQPWSGRGWAVPHWHNMLKGANFPHFY